MVSVTGTMRDLRDRAYIVSALCAAIARLATKAGPDLATEIEVLAITAREYADCSAQELEATAQKLTKQQAA